MIVIIPARLESTRLKNKMLIEIEGKPLIRKVRDDIMDLGYDAYVATDSDEIAKAVKGGLVLRTSQHPNGTLRAMAAAKAIGEDKFILVQGDCLGLSKHTLESIEAMLYDNAGDLDAVTAVKKFRSKNEMMLPSKVKTIHNGNRMMWNTRQNIGYGDHHVGVYGFNNLDIAQACVGDTIEDLEQNEWLLKGFKVGVVSTTDNIFDINTEDDVREVLQRRTSTVG